MSLELKIRTHRILGHRKKHQNTEKNRTHWINSALEMLISIWTHNYNLKCRLILWKIQSEILNYTKWYSWMIVKNLYMETSWNDNPLNEISESNNVSEFSMNLLKVHAEWKSISWVELSRSRDRSRLERPVHRKFQNTPS